MAHINSPIFSNGNRLSPPIVIRWAAVSVALEDARRVFTSACFGLIVLISLTLAANSAQAEPAARTSRAAGVGQVGLNIVAAAGFSASPNNPSFDVPSIVPVSAAAGAGVDTDLVIDQIELSGENLAYHLSLSLLTSPTIADQPTSTLNIGLRAQPAGLSCSCYATVAHLYGGADVVNGIYRAKYMLVVGYE